MNQLISLFPSTMLEDYAEEHGVVEREGEIQVSALVSTFVFGFATGES
jgi:putative transposase